MQTKVVDADRIGDLGGLINVLERNGLTIMDGFFKDKDTAFYVARYKDYKDDHFDITIKRDIFSMDVRPKNRYIRNFVPYPKDLLPLPHGIEIHYDLDDLTTEVREALRERGSKIIDPREILAGGIMHSDDQNFQAVVKRPKPYLVLYHAIQRPNEKYLKCIAPIDPENFDPNIFPYHNKQEERGHHCIEDEPFPFIPIGSSDLNIGLSLSLGFSGVEKERIEDLLVGIPLTINTYITFNEDFNNFTRMDRNSIFLTLYNTNKPYVQYGNGQFVFYYNINSLVEGISKILPHFLYFYRAFTR